MAVNQELIHKQRYFKDLTAEHIQALLACASPKHYETGEFVFKLGEKAETFYLITQGSVALEMYSSQRGIVKIQTLHEGDILGWSWLFPPHKWHFDAHVLEPTEVIAFDARAFFIACEADHEMGYQIQQRFARIMVERLQATRLQLLDIYGD